MLKSSERCKCACVLEGEGGVEGSTCVRNNNEQNEIRCYSGAASGLLVPDAEHGIIDKLGQGSQSDTQQWRNLVHLALSAKIHF